MKRETHTHIDMHAHQMKWITEGCNHQPEDQCVRLVAFEDSHVTIKSVVEIGQAADADGLSELEIRLERLGKHGLAEDLALWYFADEQLEGTTESGWWTTRQSAHLHNNRQFVHVPSEAQGGSAALRTLQNMNINAMLYINRPIIAYLPNALQKLGVCITVVELDRLDLGQVEKVTHKLIVGNSLWE